jgi:hypothetical protein
VLFVVDADAARAALRVRLLACPREGCRGRLGPWSRARARTVTVGVGQRERVTPDRGRCRVCRVSQTLLPGWYLPRRSASVEVVGAAIQGRVNVGHSHEQVARVLGLNPDTVRGWLRRVHAAAPAVRSITHHIVARIGYVAFPERPLRPLCVPATEEVALAFAELGYAVRAVTQHAQREAERIAHRVNATGARTTLGLWPAVNLASGGRLLTMITSRAAAT